MSRKRFEGKVAIITGSSRGIGKAIARELAGQGAWIVMNGRNPERLSEARKELLTIHDKVISVCCDVSTPEGGQYLVDECQKAFGKIDILINNVGVSMRGHFADLHPGVFNTMYQSNIMGAVCPSIPAIGFLRQTRGSLVFISSLAGIRGLPWLSGYCSAKMALRALAESIRIEETRHKIHVGMIYVGYTEIEEGKETIIADGSLVKLQKRTGKGVQTTQSVAISVVKNLTKRKFVTILTPLGKLNYLMQRCCPWLVERIILSNLKKFEARSG